MIVDDTITIEAYHASEFVSHSKLKTFAEYGPFGYWARHLVAGGPKREQSSEMRFGSAFEDFVQLDAATFAARWQEAPALEGKADDVLLAESAALGVTSDDGKPFSKRHDAKTVHLACMRAKGTNVLSRNDFVRLERMAEAFRANADVQWFIKSARTQVTLRDDLGGLDMLPGIQCRPDWYGAASVDLKTTSDFVGFDRAIVNLGYHSQAALIDVIAGEAPRFLIASESDWPYRCQLVEIPRALLDVGREWCERQIDALRACYARDEWPKCAPSRVASVPGWVQRKADGDGW